MRPTRRLSGGFGELRKLELSAVSGFGDTIVSYRFDIATGKHRVAVLRGCHSSHHVVEADSPGEAINLLIPYRETASGVSELIGWLSGQCKLSSE